jgi:deazaflavin-dependent oxidoreductase (nitroreductase family)
MSSPPEEGQVGRSLIARLLHSTTRFPRLAGAARRVHVAVFTVSHGRLMGRWFGSPVLVLETTGRISGKRRRATITYCRVTQGYVVIPINAGARRIPAWWLNLRQNGRAIATTRIEGRFPVQAREAAGPERDRLWARYVQQAPVIEAFREYAARPIPVVVLEPGRPGLRPRAYRAPELRPRR